MTTHRDVRRVNPRPSRLIHSGFNFYADCTGWPAAS